MSGIVSILINQYNEFFQGRKVLVTGGGGHLGSQLVRLLIACKAQVLLIVRPSTDIWRLSDQFSNIIIHQADITQLDAKTLAERIEPVDFIYHIAAAGVNPQDNDTNVLIRSNVEGTLNVLKLAKILKAKRFIYCGSCFEYGSGEYFKEEVWPKPNCEYGASKVAGWVLAHAFGRKHGLPLVSLRPFTLYGPWESPHRLVSHVIRSVIEKKDIDLTDGKQSRDFVFIDDVARAFLNAAYLPSIEGETFNVGSGQSTTVKQMVDLILYLMQSKIKINWGALPHRSAEKGLVSADTTKAEAYLQWRASTTLEAGLQQTIDWIYANKRRVA